jgi:hypothetical protein
VGATGSDEALPDERTWVVLGCVSWLDWWNTKLAGARGEVLPGPCRLRFPGLQCKPQPCILVGGVPRAGAPARPLRWAFIEWNVCL